MVICWWLSFFQYFPNVSQTKTTFWNMFFMVQRIHINGKQLSYFGKKYKTILDVSALVTFYIHVRQLSTRPTNNGLNAMIGQGQNDGYYFQFRSKVS